MNFHSRYSISPKAQTTEPCKAWSIGWTLGEAISAAQQTHTRAPTAAKRDAPARATRKHRR